MAAAHAVCRMTGWMGMGPVDQRSVPPALCAGGLLAPAFLGQDGPASAVGLSQPEHGANGLDVDASVALDPPPDPGVWVPVLALGGEREGRPGGSETAGAFGPFVFPEGTERVTVELRQITLVPADAPRAMEVNGERRLGTLELEIPSGAAQWTPA